MDYTVQLVCSKGKGMSRTADILKNRNKYEKELREKKVSEMNRMRKVNTFAVVLVDRLRKISIILEDSDVKSVIIEINKEHLSEFGHMITESEELADFNIKQVKGIPNQFIISKKFIEI